MPQNDMAPFAEQLFEELWVAGRCHEITHPGISLNDVNDVLTWIKHPTGIGHNTAFQKPSQ